MEAVFWAAEDRRWRVEKGKKYFKMWCPCPEKHWKDGQADAVRRELHSQPARQLRRATCWESGLEVTDYVVIQEVAYTGDLTGDRLDALMDALMEVEAADPAITDPDVAASLEKGSVDVQMTFEAADQGEAATKGLCALRTAVHAIGSPGWKTRVLL